MTKPKFINSIKELGKAYRDKRGRRPQAPVPVEFCPECMSLKRKPNKDCKNHESYWIKKNEPSAMHNIIIEKYEGKYIVRCVGSYADLVRGRNTDYEFSERFKTLKEAKECADTNIKRIVADYKNSGKKVHVSLIQKI